MGEVVLWDDFLFYIPAVLASVPVHPHDITLLVLETRPVLNLLLDTAAEESLTSLAGMDAVVEPRSLVTAHSAQHSVSIELYNIQKREKLMKTMPSITNKNTEKIALLQNDFFRSFFNGERFFVKLYR